jgi:hypothetical protein
MLCRQTYGRWALSYVISSLGSTPLTGEACGGSAYVGVHVL